MVEPIPGYTIEREGHGSLAGLPDIIHAAAQVFPEEDLPARMREQVLPVSFFETAAQEGRLFVATEIAGRFPVGFAVTTRVDGSSHLFELDVLPEHGRRGLGRALVEKVVDRARELGDPSVTLTTFRHLAWNAPFYMKLGFETLESGQMGPELMHCLESEARRGLDPAKRVAMRLSLEKT